MKQARKNIGFNQDDLAEKSGLSLGMIKDIERGKKWPSPASLEAISKALKVPVSILFDENEDKGSIDDLMNLLARTYHYQVRKKV